MRHIARPAVLLAVVVLSACSRPAPAPEPVRAVRTITVQAASAGGHVDYAAEIRARTEYAQALAELDRIEGRTLERHEIVLDELP